MLLTEHLLLPVLYQGVWQGKLFAALFTVEHLLVELLHVHPVDAVALESQVTPFKNKLLIEDLFCVTSLLINKNL